jgi:uncharacterized membrane-anchored protein YjiN (DUF445 family)
MDTQEKSRFAELAMELMGAQTAARFLEEVWRAASAEVKAELSEKVLRLVVQRLDATMMSTSPFDNPIQGIVSRVVSEAAEPHMEELKTRIFAVVKDQIEGHLVGEANQAARRCLDKATREVLERVRLSSW